MIKEITNLNELNYIFKKFFNKEISLNDFQKCLIYTENNEILGFIIYSMIYERCELDYIAVLENYQNKKIGSKLVQYMINDCEKNNISNITLEVNINNINAINLYKKHGFKQVTIRNNYYGSDDAYLMQLEVGE